MNISAHTHSHLTLTSFPATSRYPACCICEGATLSLLHTDCVGRAAYPIPAAVMGGMGGSAATFLAVCLMASCIAAAAGQAVPVEGGPFNDLTEPQLSFEPPPGVDIKHRNFVGKSPKDSAGFQGARYILRDQCSTCAYLDHVRMKGDPTE